MIKGVIFDLDQTLVDSSIAEIYRNQRNWSKVYELIPKFHLYQGFQEVFTYIKANHLQACVVTTSPSRYASKVISHFGIPCEFIVDYFATARKKPYPDPMLKALDVLNMKATEVISFGDRAIDIEASNNAGIKSVACLWGTGEKISLIKANPANTISNPNEIISLIKE